MTGTILERYSKPPSAIGFMARAFLPSAGFTEGSVIPPIVQRWGGVRIEENHLGAFRQASGLHKRDGACVLYPHVLGFRLQMALLTHRAFPLPIWGVLQIRNRLTLHRRFYSGARFDLETSLGKSRVLEKGIEFDLISRMTRDAECVWESVVTFYYRGRFGASSGTQPAEAPDLAQAPTIDRFSVPQGGGWHFGKLTGDYNGIHWAKWYARRLGFRGAFPHPQRIAGMCLARLPEPESEKQTLQLWIKGPVFYGARVALKADAGRSGVEFGLSLDGDNRYAISGIWRSGDKVP